MLHQLDPDSVSAANLAAWVKIKSPVRIVAPADGRVFQVGFPSSQQSPIDYIIMHQGSRMQQFNGSGQSNYFVLRGIHHFTCQQGDGQGAHAFHQTLISGLMPAANQAGNRSIAHASASSTCGIFLCTWL